MPSHRFTAEECKKTGIWAMTPEERRAAQSRGGKTSHAKIRRPEITEKYLIDLVFCPPFSIRAMADGKADIKAYQHGLSKTGFIQ